ncbi:short-chain dehydrogenase [Mammaliicoccus sciuri]|uniref:SDR family NAD(P)-dependent oxidoreductase n=1 Tax=Mammaliicoccus sciuri TaxID=1296 RepID=UPI000BBE9F03|nr:SDR family NAD(P)-dependent oxidoreductase [Mammaliicoccus sciuri]PCM39969.1 short-chain dehydrogenase [Mammaliicoccus sciuri]
MNSKKRNIVITGAGSGIGASTVNAFNKSGDVIHLIDISKERLDKTSENLNDVFTYTVDISNRNEVRTTIENIAKDYGSIDVLVSNAGIFDGLAGIQETTYELWDRIIDVNLTGAFNVIKPISEIMINQKSGRIITISSIAATRTSPDGLSYDASKAGLEGMTRRLAVDLGSYGITANAVAPGVINTSILGTSQEILGSIIPKLKTDNNDDANADFVNNVVPARRGGDPSEVAETIHFLASKGASYINGEVIHVDGGWIAN